MKIIKKIIVVLALISPNTLKAFEAGCNLVLHCNGKHKEMLIVAKNSQNGIGYQNDLLFRLKEDMFYFSNVTQKTQDNDKMNGLIMGYNTWVSIPNKFKPLKNRFNIVITNNNYTKLQYEKDLNNWTLKDVERNANKIHATLEEFFKPILNE